MTFPSQRRHQGLIGGLLALLVALLPGLAVPQAAQPVYCVEIIVFRATGGPGAAENWATSATKSARGPATESDRGGAAQVGRFVSRIPPAELQLGDLQAKLASSGAWQPLAHVGWVQTASSWGSRAGFTTGQVGINVPGLSGVVYLERGTYLHLGFGLRYAGASSYALNETRRVKFYERNYYDHPAFGVIALVTPAQGNRQPGR